MWTLDSRLPATSCVLFILTLVKGVWGQQVFVVTPKSVQVKAGEDVFFRCVVQNQQGNAQWTKDGFALGFGRTVPGYPRYRYAGDSSRGEHHLVIKGVTLQDDGEYQCQVGPTANTSAIWAAANLTVMVSPRSISLGERQDGDVVEVKTGQTLALECIVRDARPPPSVAWYRSGLKLDSSLHEEVVQASSQRRRWSVRSILSIQASPKDDGQQYSCRALHPALNDSPTTLVASVTLRVLHAPSTPRIRGYETGEILVVGDHRTLTCEVSGGNPRPRVAWYRHGRPLNPVKSQGKRRVKDEQRKDGLISITQEVTATRLEDGAVYECRVTTSVLTQPISATVTLTVHYSPTHVDLAGPEVVRPGQHFSLTCTTSPANPPAVITWMIQGIQTTTVPYVTMEAEEGGWVTTSELSPHHLRLHKVTEISVSCRAYNPATDRVVSQSRIISVTKRPGRPVLKIESLEPIEISAEAGLEGVGGGDAPGRRVAGERLRFVCITEGGNPQPVITMHLGKKDLDLTVTREELSTKAWTEVVLMPNDNKKQVTCKVNSPALPSPLSAYATVDLLFPPLDITGWTIPSSVEPGHELTLICETSSSLPPSSITWSSRGKQEIGSTLSHTQGAFGGTVSKSELAIHTTPGDHGRVFTCEASNGLGVTVSTNVTISLLHGPVWLRAPSGTLSVLEGDDVILTASAAANPPSVSYTWWRGPVALSRLGDSEGGVGTLRLRRIRRGQAGNYSVTAHTSRGVIHSVFSINVQYGPEDITVTKRVVVEEGETTSLQCTASGNPTPNITWTRATDNTSELWRGKGEAILVIKEAMRSDTGLYLCFASSVVATAPPVSAALVVTQPPSAPAVTNGSQVDRAWAAVGDRGQLDCRVQAAPKPSFKWIVNDDRVIYNDHKYTMSPPELTDGVTEWSSLLRISDVTDDDYTNYTCVTRNIFGSYVIHFALRPPSPPIVPAGLSARAVSATSVMLSWHTDIWDSSILGYSIRFHPSSSPHYVFQEAPGFNRSQVLVEGLVPATEYSFSIQAYSTQGRSPFSSPATATTMRGIVEGAASSSSSSIGGIQQRVPRLILIIICLTGAALLILNIVIVTCFLRRYVFKRNSGNGRKNTAYSVYTPSTTPASTTYGDLTSFNPPPEYQQVRRETDSEGTSTNTLRASFGSPQKSTEPLCVSAITTHADDGGTSLESLPDPPAEDLYPQSRMAPPLIHITPPLSRTPQVLREDHQRRPSEDSIVSEKGNAVLKQELYLYGEGGCSSRGVMTQSFVEAGMEDSGGVRSLGKTSNIPDVCPTPLTSYETMLQTRATCQEVIPEFPEDEEEEEDDDDEEEEEEEEGGMRKKNAESSYHPSCQKHNVAARYFDAADSSPRRPSAVQHLVSTPTAERHNPAISNRPSSQVIFHGQPHIQQQFEKQQHQQDIQLGGQHSAQFPCPCYQQDVLQHPALQCYEQEAEYHQQYQKYAPRQVFDHPLRPPSPPRQQEYYPHDEEGDDPHRRLQCHPEYDPPVKRPPHPHPSVTYHHQQQVSPSYHHHLESSQEGQALDPHHQYHHYLPRYPSHHSPSAHQMRHTELQEPSGALDPAALYSLQTKCCEERCALSSTEEGMPATELTICGQELHSTT